MCLPFVFFVLKSAGDGSQTQSTRKENTEVAERFLGGSHQKMAIANFAYAEIFYEISGEGHPLVLIPGFASGAWSWAWQVGSFSDRFRVITFDPRGVSRSTLSDGADVSIEAIADDVANLLDAIGLDSADVLGISFGGFVAQEFALKHPHQPPLEIAI